MKKPILLLQFRTDQSLKHEVKCIMDKSSLQPDEIEVINVLDKKTKITQVKDLSKYKAVIAGGSGQFDITNCPKKVMDRIEKLKPFFLEIVEKDFPSLLICFSHQLVCHFLGEKVVADSKQSEVGTHRVTLTDEGIKSKLYKDIPKEFFVVMGHKDSVMNLPKNATPLASSEKCKIQSLQIGKNVYTTQFHPELNRDDLVYRLSLYPTYMKGKTVEEVMKQYRPIPFAKKVIQNFKNLVVNNQTKK